MTDEWAVRFRSDMYLGAENTGVGAFRVDKVTAKSLMGDALYLRQHPIEECIRGLTEAQAKAIESTLEARIAQSKDVIRRERSAIQQAVKETMEIWK